MAARPSRFESGSGHHPEKAPPAAFARNAAPAALRAGAARANRRWYSPRHDRRHRRLGAVTPEARARRKIDAQLEAAGWRVQDLADIDLTAGRGIAAREFPMKPGFGKADYLLYVDGAAAGVVEAKPFGALAGVEAQAARYAAGLPGDLPAHRRPLPFAFMSNGGVTRFADGRDPRPRARELFAFPRPETLADRLAEPRSLRARLAALPPLDESRLWAVQARAARNLEESLAHARPRALVQMATGSGKTFVAIAAAWRLLRHAEAGRILFLVDRNTLGRQAENEFVNFAPPGESRKFGELYAVQRLEANRINPAAKVVIATVQRLFSMLRGEAGIDPDRENESAFGNAAAFDDEEESDPWLGPAPEAAYNSALPPEFFDFIIVDECHRSIYDRWSRALLYFDSFLVGLTATPDNRTIGFFDQNLVMQYGHEEAVADGVNVGFDVWRVRTEIGEAGGSIPAADRPYVAMRDKATRAERLVGLAEDFAYGADRLDRDVVAESQIRTVLREFRHRVLKEAFPDRAEAPKTLIFAKDDSHADDIVRIAREVFDEGDAFCGKITYRTGFVAVRRTAAGEDGSETETTEWVRTRDLPPEEVLANFRNAFHPRIAVTVDMISTGTDVKPIECLVFMRGVRSAAFFEQMKGRGVRVISSARLRAVTPSARVKDRFVVVDAVGVCENVRSGSRPLDRQPSKSFDRVLNYVARGGTDPDALATLGARLARLQRRLAPEELAELKDLAGGESLSALARGLFRACDPKAHAAEAKARSGAAEPDEAQRAEAARALARAAAAPFLKPAFRRRLIALRRESEQTIDRHSIDEVLYSGFDAAAVEKARAKVADFRAWIAGNRDELTALQLLYAGARPLKLSLEDLRELRAALARPPVSATPAQLWRAFEAAEAEKVAGGGGESLADLVSLARHALIPAGTLAPYRDELMARYRAWLDERGGADAFGAEQREWLDRMAEHIAGSLAIAPDDFDLGWFGQHGSLGRAHALFGDALKPLMAELNERLAA